MLVPYRFWRSLLRGDKVDSLLTETAALLGDKPWGVGILGFVPQELRDAQLEVIQRIKPPFALIAAGDHHRLVHWKMRGFGPICTPRHRPFLSYSSGMVRAGLYSRAENAGHVGPRSFGLWEQQITTLLDFGYDLSDVSVLFAGGIHDARSARCLTWLPRYRSRGASRGLDGDGVYLHGRVCSAGAVLESYQQDVLGCETTALLETAPGHATRCVENDYVRDFLAEQQRMTDEGCSKHDMWARLEQHLGRLRLASKGVRRNGDVLEEVDVETRQRQGMVMIGDAATLRTSVITMRELHRSVAIECSDVLREHHSSEDEAASVEASLLKSPL